MPLNDFPTWQQVGSIAFSDIDPIELRAATVPYEQGYVATIVQQLPSDTEPTMLFACTSLFPSRTAALAAALTVLQDIDIWVGL